jgi:hypothetical protein
MHGNRVPVHRVAVRKFAKEDTDEREHHSSSRVGLQITLTKSPIKALIQAALILGLQI